MENAEVSIATSFYNLFNKDQIMYKVSIDINK